MRRHHPTRLAMFHLLLMACLALSAGCQGESPQAVTVAAQPSRTEHAERTISLAAGGALSLQGSASLTVPGRSGEGSLSLRLIHAGVPAPAIGGAPWLYQVGNLVRIESDRGAFPKPLELQLRLLKAALPEGADEEHLFAARVADGVIQPQPGRVNLRGLTVALATTTPGDYTVFAMPAAGLRATVQASWPPPPAVSLTALTDCPKPRAGALTSVCQRASPDGDTKKQIIEAVNRTPAYLEFVAGQAESVHAAPAPRSAGCGDGLVARPQARVSWQVQPFEDLRAGSLVVTGRTSPCAGFVQVTTALLGPVWPADGATLDAVAAGWYDQVSGHRLLRAAAQAWEAGDRLGWAADTAAFLINPDKLDQLAGTLGEAGYATTAADLRAQVFATGDVLDAVGNLHAMLGVDAALGAREGVDQIEVRLQFAVPPPPSTRARVLPKGSRIAWQGGNWYLHGANLPYRQWGCDFGCGAAGERQGVSGPVATAELDQLFSEARQDGVRVVRWWLFPGDPWQISRDINGAPAGLDPLVYADIDAALALAERHHLVFVFTLFSSPSQIPKNWLVYDDERQRLIAILGELFARYRADGRILAWDVVNEPEWDIREGRVAKDDVQTLVELVADAVHARSNAYVTVGSAMLEGVGMWVGRGLDYYTVHWYDPMPPAWCARCSDYATLSERHGLDAPLVIGEFFAGPTTDAQQRYVDFYTKGFAGAFAWSLLPDKTADKMVIDRSAARAFVAGRTDIGPRRP